MYVRQDLPDHMSNEIWVNQTFFKNSFFHEKTTPPTAMLPSAINPSIMAVQKRSGAAPNKSNTVPPGPIFN